MKNAPKGAYSLRHWRKERDSNPRYRRTCTPDFESGAFDHSATTPQRVEVAILAEASGLQLLQATQVGAQHLGHGDQAVGVLVVLEHGHQGAAQCGALEIEHEQRDK